MANELTVTAKLRYAKGSGDAAVSKTSELTKTLDVSGTIISDFLQTIGTSVEAVSLGDIATLGYVLAQNKDATNYVTISTDAGGANPVVRLRAGELALFRANAAIYAQANTAACNVHFILISN